jgi:hypothetical protein
MTYLEAIKGKVNYPLSDNTFTLALLDRGLTASDTYATGQAFDLAYADAVVTLLTAPNVSEGGYSVSLSDREILLKLANGIYTKYGVTSPINSLKPKAKFVNPF